MALYQTMRGQESECPSLLEMDDVDCQSFNMDSVINESLVPTLLLP